LFLFQLAHGADPFLKNQEGQTPMDLASADDVRCLLKDAMVSQQGVPTTASSNRLAVATTPVAGTPSDQVLMPSGTTVSFGSPVWSRPHGCLSPEPTADGSCSLADSIKVEGSGSAEAAATNITSLSSFLAR